MNFEDQIHGALSKQIRSNPRNGRPSSVLNQNPRILYVMVFMI